MSRFIALFLVLVSCSCIQAKGFFGMGGDTNAQLDKLKAIGISRDHKVYSHVVIPPWSRPFKLGYCESWEWHTDKKYRDQRLEICRDLSEGSHDCDSPTGFCDDKCPYSNGSYPYWRIRNSVGVPTVWPISSIQMFTSADSHVNLISDPTKGYASTYFGPGFPPSNAFDNNGESLWVSNGASIAGHQWVAYEFEYPVVVGSVRIAGDFENLERTPTQLYVEGSCEKHFKNHETVWILKNPDQKPDIRASGVVKRRDDYDNQRGGYRLFR